MSYQNIIERIKNIENFVGIGNDGSDGNLLDKIEEILNKNSSDEITTACKYNLHVDNLLKNSKLYYMNYYDKNLSDKYSYHIFPDYSLPSVYIENGQFIKIEYLSDYGGSRDTKLDFIETTVDSDYIKKCTELYSTSTISPKFSYDSFEPGYGKSYKKIYINELFKSNKCGLFNMEDNYRNNTNANKKGAKVIFTPNIGYDIDDVKFYVTVSPPYDHEIIYFKPSINIYNGK